MADAYWEAAACITRGGEIVNAAVREQVDGAHRFQGAPAAPAAG